MRLTLCGSSKAEVEYKRWNKRLTLAGHVVYSLAVYPSDEPTREWYGPEQKATLYAVHRAKIENSEAIVVVGSDGYIGVSTACEIQHARNLGLPIYAAGCLMAHAIQGSKRLCDFAGCDNPLRGGPCALCYE